MPQFYTYIWFDPKDNTPRYVGKGIITRPFVHIRKSSTTNISRMLLKRSAEGYELKPLLIEADSEDHAFQLEKMLIGFFGRLDKKEGPLFNKTDGGDGPSGQIFSPESRKKISVSNTLFWADKDHRKTKSDQMKEYFKKPGSKEKTGAASAKRYENLEYLEEHKRARSKQCTVDGITIYPSRKALVSALGHGITGARSPNFKYISGPSYERRHRDKT